ncbi:hypothetical protein L227DRAFT_649330 [Lentinus tigrinus ALCF2SS1-6]|uniref:F-box domain-containing protein n=1 Tax=Lentinus tigrinus ALCF2SS1-6 TaxID=1328759 RepID=A0A5C2STE3_9APHY|nr:hypothetical protein L227DRAFT_649330 [Lentinus tigrinus ALCF2SS1-6]
MDSPPPLITPQQDDTPTQERASLDYPYNQTSLVVPELSTLLNRFDLSRIEGMTIWPSLNADATSITVQLSADCKDWTITLPVGKLHAVDLISSGYYNFKNLSKLYLNRVSPPWKAVFFSRLRALSIWDCADDTPKMDLQAFIDMVATWTSLQELELHNVLTAVLRDASESQSTTRRATLPKLELLTLVDLPEYTRCVLSCLKLPVCILADIVGDLHHHDSCTNGRYYFWALRDIVPPPPLALAFLPFFPTCLNMDATGREVGISGSTDDNKKVMLFVTTEQDFPERARAIFFSGAAHYLSRTFSPDGRAPTSILRFKGPLNMVSTFTWVEIFRAFPQLERLTVLDEGPDGPPSDALVKALEATVLFERNPVRAVCSGLRYLSLRGVRYRKKELELLHKVLKRRTRSLGAERLNVDIEFVLPPSGRKYLPPESKICTLVRKKLASVALTVEVCCRDE